MSLTKQDELNQKHDKAVERLQALSLIMTLMTDKITGAGDAQVDPMAMLLEAPVNNRTD